MVQYILFLFCFVNLSVSDTTCASSTGCFTDSLTNECIYSVVDTMPIYSKDCSNMQLLRDIHKKLSLSDSTILAIKKGEIISTRVMLQFVITKHGELIGERIANKDTVNSLEKDLLMTIIKLDSKWSPGILNDKKVSVLYNIPIHVEVR